MKKKKTEKYKKRYIRKKPKSYLWKNIFGNFECLLLLVAATAEIQPIFGFGQFDINLIDIQPILGFSQFDRNSTNVWIWPICIKYLVLQL